MLKVSHKPWEANAQLRKGRERVALSFDLQKRPISLAGMVVEKEIIFQWLFSFFFCPLEFSYMTSSYIGTLFIATLDKVFCLMSMYYITYWINCTFEIYVLLEVPKTLGQCKNCKILVYVLPTISMQTSYMEVPLPLFPLRPKFAIGPKRFQSHQPEIIPALPPPLSPFLSLSLMPFPEWENFAV